MTAVATRRATARPAGFATDLMSIAGRALRGALREPEAVLPALVIPIFFFAVNVGALENIGPAVGIEDYRAFQLPVAIIFAVTGVNRAQALQQDIVGGYFDRLLIAPVKRSALLLGLLVADFVLVIVLSIPVLVLGAVVGVEYATGAAGLIVFLLIAGLWGIAFNGFSYAIALRTASAGAVGASFILFFPFAFLTTTFVPEDALTGWLATVAVYNPVTYVLAALRSLISEGWDAAALAGGLVAILIVAVVSFTLSTLALRGRISRG
ncbi:transport permease protein [Agromyces luteolus]|uniref:Transport permease protein n=1 Tax=Agromyces luteolus TaxID=88373 RepID=A0A7C9HFQ1_9MICO|nr:ABC transporter permease [Agromyces luteolus]MUN05761.1 ABC transporter permease [Agromyces luteolus]GLK26307.1 transport permease protein [Agromyces luteolus]